MSPSIGKPIWVAELGYEGSDAYIKPWMETATMKQSDFPELQEVVYFNDRDVHAWPFNLGGPTGGSLTTPATEPISPMRKARWWRAFACSDWSMINP